MIKVILFDVGNVLLNFKPEEYYKVKFDEKTVKEVQKVIFSGEEWNLFDQGLLDEGDLKKIFVERAPHLKHPICFIIDTICDILTPIEEMVNFALSCKKNYRISILSNMPKSTYHYIIEKYSFLSEFELPLYSYAYKLIKPDIAIYNLQLERLNIKADECLFIDDRQENIDAAQKAGMHAILMKNPKDTIKEALCLLKSPNL